MTTLAEGRPETPLRRYLFDLTLHGIKLGLENIQALCCAADNPHLAYPVVHVGGTNGKGSVVAMVAAMLTSAGYRVGRFTSPHLIDLSERFLIGGAPISEEALEDHIAYFRDAAGRLGRVPTFFEMNTAIAFRYFARENVDVAVIEVGMGGRYDSTNVVTPLAAGITNIDFDHTQYLGDTRAKIASEKAGIIKQGVPVVVTEEHPEALEVIRRRADEAQAPMLLSGRDFQFAVSGRPRNPHLAYQGPVYECDTAPLGLAGVHQGANAAAAVTLAGAIGGHFPLLTRQHVLAGLANVRWPCRAEKVLDQPPVFIDVAHNLAGAERTAALFEECVLVFSASSDKDARGMLAALRPRARHIILSQFNGKRATPVETLREVAGDLSVETRVPLTDAIARGMELATGSCPLLITGSVYTAGEAREILITRFGAAALRF